MAGTRRIEGAGSSKTNDRIHQPRFVVGRKWHSGGELSRPQAANYRTAAVHQFAGRKRRYQYDFAKPAKVSSVEVYWKDDKQYCILPTAWRLLYRDGSDWKAVQASDPYA